MFYSIRENIICVGHWNIKKRIIKTKKKEEKRRNTPISNTQRNHK